jgi:hypothetical protein
MDSQRPKRHIRKPSRYSQSPPSIPLGSQKPAIPEVRRPKKRPLQAIQVEPTPEDLAESLPSRQRSIPLYTPPLSYIEYMGVFPRGTIGALSLPVANVSGVRRTRRIDD